MSGPGLIVEVLPGPGRALVILRGELDADGVADADAALAAAASLDTPVVLDLRALDFIDSSGLRLALDWNRRLRDLGLAFSVVRGAPHVQRPFSSAGVDELLAFVDAPPP